MLPSAPQHICTPRAHPATEQAGEPQIGVVTVTYNAAPYLEAFYRDCWKQSHTRFLLFVIDNASSDGTLEITRNQSDPRLRLVPLDFNVGFAEGSNIGIRKAREEGCSRILLLNNDTEFPRELFATLLSEMKRLGAGVLAPKILFFDQPRRLWSAGGKLDPLRGWSSVHFGEGKTDSGEFDSVRRVNNLPGCCMLVDATVFDRVGVFDPRFFVYFEDTDFCIRATRLGESVWFTPATYLLHKVSSSTGGEDSPFSLRMYSRNKVYYLLKNFGAAGWLWVVAYLIYVVQMGLLGRRGGLASMRVRLRQCGEGVRMAGE